MTSVVVDQFDLSCRAQQSLGISDAVIHRMVAHALKGRHQPGGTLLDVGCGRGNLWAVLKDNFDRYIGADAVSYAGFPSDGAFFEADLDSSHWPLPDESADVVAAVETIEHMENPRAFVRELVRLAKPGGWVLVTTPNQLSFLSKMTLVLKNSFNAFQDSCYPAHITALLEIDLRRIVHECGLIEIITMYTSSPLKYCLDGHGTVSAHDDATR